MLFFPQQRAKKEEPTATQHTPATMEMWKGGTCTVDSHSLKHTTFIFFTLPQISGSGKSKIYLSRKFAIFHRQNERKLCILYSRALQMTQGPELSAGTEPVGPEKTDRDLWEGEAAPWEQGETKTRRLSKRTKDAGVFCEFCTVCALRFCVIVLN